MFKGFEKRKPYFRGVAIAILLVGAVIVALGVVELAFNLWGGTNYTDPVFKVIGGLIVTSLGYIHLELELLRTK